jgi:hypothetical protein
MNRIAINASPRGKKSNSRLIISWIDEGIRSALPGEPVASIPVLDLADLDSLPAQLEAFLAADEAVIVMPLYTDQAPGIFVRFVDGIADLMSADRAGTETRLRGKRVGFVVQSGFPESIQSETLRDWLLRLGERLGFNGLGVAIKGGIEGIRLRPENSMGKLKAEFMALGSAMGRKEAFPMETLERMAKPRKLGPFRRIAMRVLKPTGLLDFYWNYMLKKHGAWERRFDAPYA